MSGAPMLTGMPRHALLMQGMQQERERSEESRAKKRKALQEMADLAAKEGRELSMDEWYRMAQDVAGPTAFLTGDAPTSSILESMRQTQNQKAQEAAKQRKFEEQRRGLQLEDEVESRVQKMARSGLGEVEIAESIRDNYGDDVARRFTPRLGQVMGMATYQDRDMGMRLGASVQSTEEAEQFIKQNPHLTDFAKEGVRQAAQLNEEKNESAIGQIGNVLAQNGGYMDDSSTRQWVLRQLPPHLQRSPRSQEYVERVMKSAAGAAGITSRQADFGIGQLHRQTWTGAGPAIATTDAQIYEADQQRVEQKVAAAQKQVQASIQARAAGAVAQLEPLLKNKNKEVATIAADATSFLSQYDVPTEYMSRITQAATSGDQAALTAAMRDAQAVSVPLAEINQATVKAEMARAGRLSGPPQQMYAQVASIGREASTRVLAARGAAIKRLFTTPNMAGQAQAQLGDAITKIAQAVSDTRMLLAESGVFEADASTIGELDQQNIMAMVAPLAQASGIPAQSLADAVMNQVQPPQGIRRTRQTRDVYRDNVQQGRGFFNFQPQAPSYGPQGGGYPMGSNAPF